MTRLAFLVREALVNLQRNALVVVGAVIAVFFSLTLAFGALVLNEILRINTLAWQEGTHVVAFLKDPDQGGLDTQGQLALLEEVQQWEEIDAIRYVDKAGAYAEFQEIFADRPDLVASIQPSILPASFRIELVDIDTYQDVLFRLQANPVIREVRSFGSQIESLSSLSNVLNVVGLGLALVLGTSAIVLIANTIRMAIYARRDEVAIMKLVGASNWFIRVPFVLEGLIEGILGAGLSVLTIWILSQWLNGLNEAISLIRFTIDGAFFLRWGILFVVFGALAGVLGSFVGLSRYLRDTEGGARPGAA
jgi:cell division transport system permease protein